jgi:thiosulfate/3-mercaptopyruvate sulfurtransferase
MIRFLALLLLGTSPLGAQLASPEGPAPVPQESWTPLLVSPQWVQDNLDNRNLVILHASYDGSDYEEGHIPNARLIRMDRLVWEGEPEVGVELRSWREIGAVLAEAGVNNRSTIIVYGTNPMVAARLWMTLDVGRIGTPYFLNGGFQRWVEEERPVTTLVPRVTPGRVAPRPQENLLIDAEWILARLGHDYLVLVDARPDDEFTGADGGLGGRVNPGHIPGAQQLFWEELIESRERPVFLSRAELEAKFTDRGASLDDTLVTYCQVGLRASVVYMIARMLGYDTRFYDGSWRDWGSRTYPAIASGGGPPRIPAP